MSGIVLRFEGSGLVACNFGSNVAPGRQLATAVKRNEIHPRLPGKPEKVNIHVGPRSVQGRTGTLAKRVDFMQRTRPPFRADHVGSLLRPTALKEARAQAAAGKITAAALAAIEDREIE